MHSLSEMTKKLQQYSDEKKRLIEEKELLKTEKSNLNNRFLMEKVFCFKFSKSKWYNISALS